MSRYTLFSYRFGFPSALIALSSGVLGCAGWDNPTALDELTPSVAFEISTDAAETFDEVDVVVRVMHDNAKMAMRSAHLEIEPKDGASPWTITLEDRPEGYGAHITFYAPGEHHLHFRGTPRRHHLDREWGDHEMMVARRHVVVGPYWVELETKPAPVFEHTTAHVELFVYNVESDGTRGAAVEGLRVLLEVHDPNEVKAAVTLSEEEAGEYAGEHEFGVAGVYELHVAIGPAGAEAEGELHLPILDPNANTTGNQGQEGGHTHG